MFFVVAYILTHAHTLLHALSHTHTLTHTHTQLGDVMGEGEFGPVVLGVAKGIVPSEERTLVAVKVIGGGVEEEELNPEVALIDFAKQMKLEFANIAMILGMCTDHKPYYIIYEYLNKVEMMSL